MNKTIISVFVGLMFFGGVASAQTVNLMPAIVKPSGQIVRIPSTAIEVAPHVFDLGTAIDPVSGREVQGFAFVTPKTDYDRKQDHAKGSGGKGGATKCYAYLMKDTKWKTAEDWVMNPSNASLLDGAAVFEKQAASLAKWEDAADGVVGNGTGADIFGNGSFTTVILTADTAAPDGLNEVYFADVSSAGAIAVTTVWGVFSGPPSGRELVEWDQVYDDIDFAWSLTGEALKMDFDNIATHENGHAAGLGHPEDSCTEETMYRFADFGEIKKRDLNTGDIAGINKLY